ncbi:MAG: FAD-binding domain [Proteobacteria bacterium]|nr:FAD-binding domain [Pseudomonadota bacterium]
MRTLISGLGVAGPALAYWLHRAGAEVTIVERAPQLRRGGYVIDFWGTGYTIAERMGLLPRINERGYFVNEVRLVDGDGRRAGGFSGEVFRRSLNNRFVSLPRSELSAAIYDAIAGDVNVIWDDTVIAIDQQADGVRTTFERTPAQTFDLVFGAGGLHSPVRQLCFAREADVESYLGFMVAAFSLGGYPHRDEDVYLSYGEPGRQASRFSMRDDRTLSLFVWRDESGQDSAAKTLEARRAVLRQRFGGMRWETDEMLSLLETSEDLYFDRASQIHLPAWSKDRVALIGDAAFCPSLLAGEGSGLAMTAAYVLAGELKRANWDHAQAFANYERTMRPFIEKKQKAAAQFAGSFAPRTQLGITLRNWVTKAFVIPGVADLFMGFALKDDFTLPDYAM